MFTWCSKDESLEILRNELYIFMRSLVLNEKQIFKLLDDDQNAVESNSGTRAIIKNGFVNMIVQS